MSASMRALTKRTKAHTTLDEKATMTLENRQVAWAIEKADGSARTGPLRMVVR